MAKFWAKFFLFLLIEIFSAIFRCAEAQNFFVFDREFVVISDFLSVGNGLLGVNDNFLLAVNGNDFSITIRLKKKRKKFVKSKLGTQNTFFATKWTYFPETSSYSQC